MSDAIDDVTIVGGGDVGLITALCLRKITPDLSVTVVDDFQRDVPQVGKSTYLKIQQILHDTLEIDEWAFVEQVKPVWKASVFFRDWCDHDQFHYPFDESQKFPAKDTPYAAEFYSLYYSELYDSPDHRTKCEEMVHQRKSPWFFSASDGGHTKYDFVAYHLNTERFNTFLRDRCRERGVSLVDDEITAVETTGQRVDRIHSESTSYEADLYVDASGFNRVIKSQLDGEFVDFDIPLDSAFNARVERPLSEAVPATVIETGEYGWFWQIDTYDNRDMGYVFASDWVDDEDALAEFREHCDGEVPEDDVARYSFTSGYYDRAWVENCVTIGNAEGFVEPLQSTGLTANAHAAAELANVLSAHGLVNDDAVRDSYNAWVTRAWESIYDFISVHYRYATGDSDFWERMQSIDVSPRVEILEQEFDRNGLDQQLDPLANREGVRDLAIFRPINFYTIMRHMGAESAFYEENEFEARDVVRRDQDRFYSSTADEVETHLTLEEFYRGLLEQSHAGAMDGL